MILCPNSSVLDCENTSNYYCDPQICNPVKSYRVNTSFNRRQILFLSYKIFAYFLAIQ